MNKLNILDKIANTRTQEMWTKGGMLAKIIELASVGCWEMVIAVVSSCINFKVFSFNNIFVCTRFGCHVAPHTVAQCGTV